MFHLLDSGREDTEVWKAKAPRFEPADGIVCQLIVEARAGRKYVNSTSQI
jgi:hypothetical protein